MGWVKTFVPRKDDYYEFIEYVHKVEYLVHLINQKAFIFNGNILANAY